jgi:hypothetical protein
MNNPAYVVCHVRLPDDDGHAPQPTFAVFSEPGPTTMGLCVQSVIHKIDYLGTFGDAMTEAIKIMDGDARFVRIDDPRTSRAGWRLATVAEFRQRIKEGGLR